MKPKTYDNTYNIPEELKALKRWCAWRWELVDGKVDKVFYNPVTGEKIDATGLTIITFDHYTKH
jgi:primase-polymerase (primpol)-like protein